MSTPNWPEGGLSPWRTSRRRGPTWLDPDSLPTFAPPSDARALIAALSALDDAPPDARALDVARCLREAAPLEADAYAQALLAQWVKAGAPARNKWALRAAARLGGPATALAMAPLVRAWPGEGRHRLAELGLEAWLAMDSDLSLMLLSRVARRTHPVSIRASAREMLARAARARGVSLAALEDRAVARCGLDARGERCFDYGRRRFWFHLDDQRPRARDEAGRIRADLPRPGKRDDASLAQAAFADWKLFKRQVRETLRAQSERLESAMVEGRRWAPGAFARLVEAHPLVRPLLERLVLGYYDASTRPLETFCVDPATGVRIGLDGLPAPGSPSWRVGVVHRLHLGDAATAAWLDRLPAGAPFPQLERATFDLLEGELGARALDRWSATPVAAHVLAGALEGRGWLRGPVNPGGVFEEHLRPFPRAGVTALARYPGVGVGALARWPPIAVASVAFLPGVHQESSPQLIWRALRLGRVDPVALSEVARDLEFIVAPARARGGQRAS